MKSILLVLIVVFSPLQALAEDNDWLLGSWVMTFDPDGDTEDRLSFLEGGEFITTEASSGNQIRGTYVLRYNRVDVSLVYQGMVFMKLKLTFDGKRDKLFYRSDETGNTAYYTKIEGVSRRGAPSS